MIALRKAVLDGRHLVHGLFFDLAHMPGPDARRRILRLWQRGDRVYRLPQALLLLFAAPRWQDCRQTPAYPLSRIERYFCAFPGSAKRLKELTIEAGAVLLFRAGELSIYPPAAWQSEDPAAWIDVSDYRLLATRPLGVPPQAPVIVSASGGKSTQELFNNPGLQPANALQKMLGELQNRQPAPKRTPWLNWLAAVSGLFRQAVGADALTNQTKTGAVQRLREMAARFLLSSQLGKVFSWRQAQYFRRLLQMFDDGDLNAALRHAIPLVKVKESFSRMTPPALGLPRVRDILRISIRGSGSGAAYSFSEQFFDYLKRRYRASFERLDQQGRIQEAAFVLAELLQEIEEAVAYLEKHGEYRLAAELAEGRDARPALVVRQWVVAKDYKRAVTAARRSGAFAQAVQLLEQNQEYAEEVQKLRLIWAKILAGGGDYAAAVDVIWQVPEAQALVRTWLDQAIALGGAAAGRMLARKLVTFPDAYDDCLPAIQDLLNSTSAQHSEARGGFSKALLDETPTAQSRTLARLALRSLLRDHDNGILQWKNKALRRLLAFCADAGLSADIPSLAALKRRDEPELKQVVKPLSATFADPGSTPLSDACLLNDGRILLALGEVGLQIRQPSGKVAQRFSLPALRLVRSDSGNRFITIAQRGETLLLGRFWVERSKALAWHNTRLQHWADSFDGDLWFAGVGRRLLAIDTQADELATLWQVNDLPGDIIQLQRTRQALTLLLAVKNGIELWRYELPALALRQRQRLPIDKFDLSTIELLALRHDAAYLFRRVFDEHNQPRDWELLCCYPYVDPIAKKLGFAEVLIAPRFDQGWLLLPVVGKQGVSLYVFDIAHEQRRAQLFFAAADAVSARVQDNKLIVCDSTGRIVVLALIDGSVQLSLRV